MEKFFDEGQKLTQKSKYGEALKKFRRALNKAENADDELACRMALGDTCRMTGDFTEAVGHYEAAIILASDVDALALNDATVGLGLAKRALGFWKDSIKNLKKAETFYKKSKDEEGQAFTKWARAGALRIKGDIPEAYENFTEARKLFKALGDKSAEGYAMCGMGGTARVLGRYGKSMEHYKKANEVFKSLKDTFGTAYSHCGIGNAHRMKGEFDEAREQFVRASQLYSRIGDIVSYAYTLWSLAKTHMLTGHSVLAYKYVKEARSLFKKTCDPRGMIYCKLSVAEINSLRGNKVRAKALVDEALAEAKQWGFGVELCHAKALDAIISEASKVECYKKLGIKLSYNKLPMNIP
jgi:tetratricopeptide (TPR) repeat protein